MPNRRSTSLAFLADIGTNSVKAWRCCISCSQGAMSPRRCTSSSLLATSSDRDAGLEQRQHLGVRRRELARLDDEQDQVDVADGAHHGLVQRLVQRRAVARLEARRIDEDELRRAHGADAGDAVPRGLRLARGDADLLADQGVEQGRLADVGLADDGDQAAALGGGCVSSMLLRLWPSGPAAWRRRRPVRRPGATPPMPRSTSSEFGHLALDVECLLVGRAQRRRHAVDRQLHLAALQPFLQLGLGVLGRRRHARD